MHQTERVLHTLEPWFDDRSRVLILGTLPSPKSREYGCYYGHPQNRFWPTLAAVFGEDVPQTVPQRRSFAARHHLALWDVLESCDIHGAEDASIRKPLPNDISRILENAPIVAVFTTGIKASALYEKLILPLTGVPSIALPSTSPANRRWYTQEALISHYSRIREYSE